ncbi:uncharacterized protein [Physcomitrium patens]|uniref:uncharacterized protein isoform X2 n=1 Tax=Physcomitrium patens TaxID=3218 RepID=UPI000D162337|nr:uncharacterized protein LOC112273515 isoform X2 [Physcomitrium patens]|eukprot:XP_024358215.1 uncharacterized protein LOC112273515 isoform X2 [Physcomitrella patens]
MVQPRLSGDASKYWLRSRSARKNGGENLVFVDHIQNIFNGSLARSSAKKEEGTSAAAIPTTTSTNQYSLSGSSTAPTIRKSTRLFEKRVALLPGRHRVGPQYWLRPRLRGGKRSLLVSVKSLYLSEQQDLKDGDKKIKPCSGCCQPTPHSRKSARLIEKHAASLIGCRAGRAHKRRRKGSQFKRKKKRVCWLYLGAPWLGGCHNLKMPLHERRTGLRVDSDSGCLVVDAVNSSSEKFRDPASRPVLQRLTDLGQDDLLHSILEKLPPANLLKASRVCRSWASLCEPALRLQCQRHGWSLPRLPRGATPAFPWRSLYYRHACRACGEVGEFLVRKTLNSNVQFLLCGRCIRLGGVQSKLAQYSIDLCGVTGKLRGPTNSTPGSRPT